MKKIAFVLTLLATACASGPPKPKYVEEKNQAKFATAKELKQKPEAVLLAARAALDELTRASVPQASDTVQSENNSLYTGWVYNPTSKDKYVQYDFNGTMQRKDLAVRRIYGYEVTPSVAGSHVAMSVEEEIEEVNLKTGETEGWKRVKPEQAAYDMMFRKLKEYLSKQ